MVVVIIIVVIIIVIIFMFVLNLVDNISNLVDNNMIT